MDRFEKLITRMKNSPNNIRYDDLRALCVHYFGDPRQEGSSHAVFKTPWQGDPRINIQKSSNGQAKAYQVRQVLEGIKRITEEA